MTAISIPTAADIGGPPRPVLLPVSDDVPDVDLGVEQLASRIVGLAGQVSAATCRWLLLVAEFDAQQGYVRFGLTSTGRWLSHYCGLARRTAIEHVRVARALASFPELAAAMGAGRISFSQARAISRLADVATPRLIADLVQCAEYGTASQLEAVVRGLRTVDDNVRDIPYGRGEELSHRWRDDSRWGLTARLDPEHGALVESALETIARREKLTRAEALTRLAELALTAIAEAGDEPAPTMRGDERAAVVVHLSATPSPTDSADRSPHDAALGDAVAGCSAEHARPIARIGRGAGLPDRVVQRLLCSGRVRVATFDPRIAPGQPPTPLDIGASRRLVSDKQYRALLLRDGGCLFPGCGSNHGVEAHHVRHWIDGGKTVLANLVLLCRRHHHIHHDGEFDILALGAGRFRFLDPQQREIPGHVVPSELITSTTPIEVEHDKVEADAAVTRWDGSRLDHGFAITGLAQGLATARMVA